MKDLRKNIEAVMTSDHPVSNMMGLINREVRERAEPFAQEQAEILARQMLQRGTDEFTFAELVDWARGEIVISIGNNTFKETVWKVMNAMNSNAYKRGMEAGRNESRTKGTV